MAQTWPFSRKRHALLKIVDFLGRAAMAPLRRASKPALTPQSIRRILVIEPWNIGDVVLATPFLRALRKRYPSAEISLLAKPHARDLLYGSGLVDEIIAYDLPWTAQKNKYALAPSVMKEMRKLIHCLRERHFDVTLDSRMDIRANFLAAMTGAPHRVGYDIGGGGWLLTDVLPSDRDDSHKIDDWLALLALLGDSQGSSSREQHLPTLVVTEAERAIARRNI
ncbi:MAG: glycosyltransferase family 9 protein, partial [Gemmatimonadota bacterium]|nr:glycosyltransferase family 9 protein [Gemmatimonadota bacterium]